MAQYLFGAGTVVVAPDSDAYGNTIATPTPVELGVLQSASVDFGFDLNDNENFYCSEFVAKTLNELNDFRYNTTHKESNRILKKITKKEKFEYFPVDFFIQNPNITQVYKNNLIANN